MPDEPRTWIEAFCRPPSAGAEHAYAQKQCPTLDRNDGRQYGVEPIWTIKNITLQKRSDIAYPQQVAEDIVNVVFDLP